MTTFREAISQASSAAVCSLLAGTEAASWLGGALRIGGGTNSFAEAVRRARRGFCSNPNPSVTLPAPPFTGGQCATAYRVQIRRDRYPFGSGCVQAQQLNVQASPAVILQGPVSGIFARFAGAAATCGGLRTQEYVVQTAAGDVVVLSETETRGWWRLNDVRIDTLTRVDGLPDNCGDPEGPPVPPYSPVTITQNITYEDNSQTTVNEQGDFVLLAPVIIGGNLIAPITVDVGGVEIPVEVNLSTGDITLDFGPNDTPTPVTDEDPVENPTEDEPEVEEDKLIYGLVVYSTRVGSTSDITTLVAQQSAPSLRLPRTGNVYFQVPVGDRVSWLGPIPVQMENQLVRVPWGMGATGYRLVPNTGWTMTAVRLGKPPCGCSSG